MRKRTENSIIPHLRTLSKGKKDKIIQEFAERLELDINTLRNWKSAHQVIHCPDCTLETKVVCNGRITPGSERKRYLCRGCNKTFNDLTGTLLHRTKYPNKWPAYLETMLEGNTIRESAALLDISPTTSFTWRKKIMKHLDAHSIDPMQGIVEVAEHTVKTSLKGQTTPRKTVHQDTPQQTILFAINRSDTIFAGHIEPYGQFADKFATASYIIPESSNMIRDGIPLRYLPLSSPANRQLFNTRHVDAFKSEFVNYYAKMRGVATDYLQKYANWFKLLQEVKLYTLHEGLRKLMRICISNSYKPMPA